MLESQFPARLVLYPEKNNAIDTHLLQTEESHRFHKGVNLKEHLKVSVVPMNVRGIEVAPLFLTGVN